MQNRQTVEWSEEADQKLFRLFKEKGSCWSVIAVDFPGLSENQVKNRFYSTLRRLATKKAMDNPNGEQLPKTKKKDLIAFVDEAIAYGHSCSSKRGRKRKMRPSNPSTTNAADNQQNNNKSENEWKEFSGDRNMRARCIDNEYEEEKLQRIEVLNVQPSELQLKEKPLHEDFIYSDKSYNHEDSKLSIEIINPANNQQLDQSIDYGLVDEEYVELLLMQNDDILNEFAELKRGQRIERGLKELLELERKMEMCLQETQEVTFPLRAQVSSYCSN
eukprot:TRINITY_DN2147_c0_g1_i7.p1 TRINITY_DN2147_c0_g1~~TRINITY_DN2147_c0_g1_i7.p1  ORF type:complete len:274 (+),score=73.64 TRINITY_DN2147_c0_g1_i7:455-1276(+)